MYLSKQLFAIGTCLALGGNLMIASPTQTMNRTELPRRINIAANESDTFGTISTVIAKHMGIDVSEIKKSSSLAADLGMDSLDLVEVVMECEKQFSVSFPDEMWNNFGKNATVKDLVNAFDSLLKKDDKTSNNTISFSQANIKVNGTPYEMLVALLNAGDYPTTDLSLETLLPYDVVEGVLPSLKKNMKIKDKVALPVLPVPASVSEVLTAMMQAKYGSKSNKNKDFEKIRYSLNSADFEQYIAKYPKSKHIAEAEGRRKCAEQHEDWLKAKRAGSREMYEAYAWKYYYGGKKPLEAPEGYETLVTFDYQRARAIASWYDMLQSEIDTYWLTNGTIDCSIYTDYLDECGKYTCFTDVVNDSLNRCIERTAWQEADKTKTIASYQSYVDEFPDGLHVRYAKAKLDDWKAWHSARKMDSYSGYCEYFNEYPEGDSVALAIPHMKQKEQEWWDNAQKKNTLAAYDDFIDRFPNGYYASDAKNLAGEMRLKGMRNQKETIKGLVEIGKYSQLGYSLIGLANLDKSITMTVSLIGKTGEKVVLKHGKSHWTKVKNGKYKILVEASRHESWWGNVEFENGIYIGDWYSVTKYNNFDFDLLDRLSGFKPYDEEAETSFANEAIMRIIEEKAKLEE